MAAARDHCAGQVCDVARGPGAARKKKEQAQLDLLAADEIERPALAAPLKPGEPTPEELRLQQARALAKQNPIAVANIVKTWVNGEAN